MNGWWVQTVLERHGPVYLVSWIVWVIGAIVLHELAHGWAALRLGDRTPAETGHMTLNPFVHMGQASLLMFAIFGIAWGGMPVNPARLRGRYGDAIVSIAGPLMNLALCALSLAGFVAWIGFASGHWGGKPIGEPLSENVFNFLLIGVRLNLILFAFNLLPVPPLDGSRILSSLFPPFARLWEGPNAGIVGMIVFAALFIFGGRYVWAYADWATAHLVLWGLRAAHLPLPP